MNDFGVHLFSWYPNGTTCQATHVHPGGGGVTQGGAVPRIVTGGGQAMAGHVSGVLPGSYHGLKSQGDFTGRLQVLAFFAGKIGFETINGWGVPLQCQTHPL